MTCPAGSAKPCCSEERPVCCPEGAKRACCPADKPVCCRRGAKKTCCPAGTTCTKRGCKREESTCPPGADSCAGSGVVACGAVEGCECHQSVDGEPFCASFFSCPAVCETDADCDAIGGVFAGATCIRCPLVCGETGACAVPCPSSG